MGIEDVQKHLDDAVAVATRSADAASSTDELRGAESRLLGRSGPIAAVLGSIKSLPPEQRGRVGQLANQTKQRIAAVFATRRNALRDAAAAGDQAGAACFDPTLPGPAERRGAVHPVTAVQWEVEDALARMGFVVVSGPEMESDYYNFEALNIPAMHPARDMQDTFWLDNGLLLRTHTSPCQVRAMKRFGAPLRVIAPGRCFRYETLDASHENTFFQVEGLLIDRGISIANLIAVMKAMLREVLRRDLAVRLRPGYFPFVEPGFELDMSCAICDGKGCPTCQRSGWIEICPCGMVHPNVLRMGDIDPAQYTGFAFGLGLTRLAMMKYGIADIRLLNSGDLRALVPPEKLAGPLIAVHDD
ncbi:MAG: phenylalanine--tRNA ligase subunit alpha [Phycisphaerae bacterium]